MNPNKTRITSQWLLPLSRCNSYPRITDEETEAESGVRPSYSAPLVGGA